MTETDGQQDGGEEWVAISAIRRLALGVAAVDGGSVVKAWTERPTLLLWVEHRER
jgi:hypothetical protein